MLARMHVWLQVLMDCRLQMTSVFFDVISFCRSLRGLPPETFADLVRRRFGNIFPWLAREIELKREDAGFEAQWIATERSVSTTFNARVYETRVLLRSLLRVWTKLGHHRGGSSFLVLKRNYWSLHTDACHLNTVRGYKHTAVRILLWILHVLSYVKMRSFILRLYSN